MSIFASLYKPSIKRHLTISKYFWAHPFEWEHVTEKMVLTKSWKRTMIHKIQLALSLIYLIVITLNLFTGNFSLQTRLQSSLLLLLMAAALGLRWNWDSEKGVMELTNSLLEFENTFPKSN